MAIAASYGVWVLWMVSWAIASVWSSRATARARTSGHLLHWAATIAGFLILFEGVGPRRFGYGWRPSVATSGADSPWQWAMFAVVVAGFVFAWWARIHLGSLWSASVTRKADHHIVDTGPYSLVRHPIYTGLVLSSLGLAAQEGRISGWIGAALIAAGFWIKAGLEERFLREQLGQDDYDAYRVRTPMLVPFLRLPR
jgi:protein-S-isoprenylcysteine O-methyltransferase Ste14